MRLLLFCAPTCWASAPALRAPAPDRSVSELQEQLPSILREAGCKGPHTLWGVRLDHRPDPSDAPRQAALLAAFLRARDGDVPATRRMLVETIRWRRVEVEPVVREPFAACYPTKLLCVSRPGLCLVLDTRLLPAETFADQEQLVRWWVSMQEALMSRVFAADPPRYTLVVDCSGLRVHHFGQNARGCATQLAAVMAEYYPDMIDHTEVVRPPPLFACCWAAVRPFLPRDFVRSVRVKWHEKAPAVCVELTPLPYTPKRRFRTRGFSIGRREWRCQ